MTKQLLLLLAQRPPTKLAPVSTAMIGAVRRHALTLCDERLVVLACKCYGCEACAGRSKHTLVVLAAQHVGGVLPAHGGESSPSMSAAGNAEVERDRDRPRAVASICYAEKLMNPDAVNALVTDTLPLGSSREGYW